MAFLLISRKAASTPGGDKKFDICLLENGGDCFGIAARGEKQPCDAYFRAAISFVPRDRRGS